MLEKLMDPEWAYGEPEYSEASGLIAGLRKKIFAQLDAGGQHQLEELTAAYLRQETAILHDAFADGFWTAVELMLEFHQKKRK